jgi:hypothetical protein
MNRNFLPYIEITLQLTKLGIKTDGPSFYLQGWKRVMLRSIVWLIRAAIVFILIKILI